MGMTVRELVAKFGLDFDAQSFAKGNAAVEGLKANAATLARWGAVIGTAVAAGAAHAVREIWNLADETSKAADRFGLTAEALQEIQYAGDLAGVSAQDLERSLGLLGKKLGDAAQGEQEAADSFAQIGLSIRDARGQLKGTEKVLEEVADKMAGASSAQERLRIAMDLFGARGGQKFVALMKDGAAGLIAARKEARELGAVFSGGFARQAEQVNDNLTRLGKGARGVMVAFVEAITPAVVEATDGMVAWMKENQKALRMKVAAWAKEAAGFIVKLGRAALDVAGLVGRLVSALGGFRTILVALGGYIGTAFLAKIGLAVAGLGGFSVSALAAAAATFAWNAALGALVVGLTGVLVLLGDELAALADDNVDGLFEKLAGRWGELADAIKASKSADDPWHVALLKDVGVVAAEVVDWIDRLFATLFQAPGTSYDDFWILGLINSLFEGIANVIIWIGDLSDDAAQFFDLLPVRARQAANAIYGFFAERVEAIKALLLGAVNSTPLGKAITTGIDIGGRLLGGQAAIGPSAAVQAAAANRQATANTSVSVQVDASGQSLDEGQLSSMLTRQVTEALTTANRDAAFALTPALAGG